MTESAQPRTLQARMDTLIKTLNDRQQALCVEAFEKVEEAEAAARKLSTKPVFDWYVAKSDRLATEALDLNTRFWRAAERVKARFERKYDDLFAPVGTLED